LSRNRNLAPDAKSGGAPDEGDETISLPEKVAGLTEFEDGGHEDRERYENQHSDL
jgi:hypothetical protein